MDHVDYQRMSTRPYQEMWYGYRKAQRLSDVQIMTEAGADQHDTEPRGQRIIVEGRE